MARYNMLIWFEKNYDVSLAFSNLANLLKINLKKSCAMLGELLSVCRRIFELRPNFLKHSQNSNFNYKDVYVVASTNVCCWVFKQGVKIWNFFCIRFNTPNLNIGSWCNDQYLFRNYWSLIFLYQLPKCTNYYKDFY